MSDNMKLADRYVHHISSFLKHHHIKFGICNASFAGRFEIKIPQTSFLTTIRHNEEGCPKVEHQELTITVGQRILFHSSNAVDNFYQCAEEIIKTLKRDSAYVGYVKADVDIIKHLRHEVRNLEDQIKELEEEKKKLSTQCSEKNEVIALKSSGLEFSEIQVNKLTEEIKRLYSREGDLIIQLLNADAKVEALTKAADKQDNTSLDILH